MPLNLNKPDEGDIDWTADVNQNFTDIEDAINQGVPTGAIQMFGGSSAPTGWLLCDGTAVSRTTYSALFTVLGTTFGAGDGSTTFNLPDMRGRSPLGAGQGSGLTNRTRGQSVGSETHVLGVSELPSHSHSVSDSGHSHTIPRWQSGSFGATFAPSSFSVSFGSVSTNSATTGISIQNTGGGAAHNNMQPCLVVNFVVKT